MLVIDDDLGQSARSATQRAGFQRLLAELSLSHVGMVLGIDMSRLARSCKDWYQLLELCALFGISWRTKTVCTTPASIMIGYCWVSRAP